MGLFFRSKSSEPRVIKTVALSTDDTEKLARLYDHYQSLPGGEDNEARFRFWRRVEEMVGYGPEFAMELDKRRATCWVVQIQERAKEGK